MFSSCYKPSLLALALFMKIIYNVLSADVLYDLGTALEIVSPLCPHFFLEVAGVANLAKGIFECWNLVLSARCLRCQV